MCCVPLAVLIRVVQVRRGKSGGSLVVSHDGREFDSMDVLGLSSVGLSTKAAKRTVGFMGIGFKVQWHHCHTTAASLPSHCR